MNGWLHTCMDNRIVVAFRLNSNSYVFPFTTIPLVLNAHIRGIFMVVSWYLKVLVEIGKDLDFSYSNHKDSMG